MMVKLWVSPIPMLIVVGCSESTPGGGVWTGVGVGTGVGDGLGDPLGAGLAEPEGLGAGLGPEPFQNRAKNVGIGERVIGIGGDGGAKWSWSGVPSIGPSTFRQPLAGTYIAMYTGPGCDVCCVMSNVGMFGSFTGGMAIIRMKSSGCGSVERGERRSAEAGSPGGVVSESVIVTLPVVDPAVGSGAGRDATTVS